MSKKEAQNIINIELQNPFNPEMISVQIQNAQKFQELVENKKVSALMSEAPVINQKAYYLNLLLAYGHFKSRQGRVQKSKLFPQKSIQALIDTEFKKEEDLIYSLIFAAGNCFRQLMYNIAGNSIEIIKVKQLIWHACFGKSLYHAYLAKKLIRSHNILLIGGTGTGKELFADVILDADYTGKGEEQNPADRGNKIKINIAAIPENLIESELFGHKKGAFTGASKDKEGAFGVSHNGIIFLDEIGDLPIHQQVKILRVVEYGEVFKLGANKPKTVDVRIVSATNQNVFNEELFKPELLQRIGGTLIKIPPLSNRKSDIIAIGNRIYSKWVTKELNDEKGKFYGNNFSTYLKGLSTQNYDWPGNVRELENFIKKFLVGIEEEPEKVWGSLKKKCDISFPIGIINKTWSRKKLDSWYAKEVYEKEKSYKKTSDILDVAENTATKLVKNNDK